MSRRAGLLLLVLALAAAVAGWLAFAADLRGSPRDGPALPEDGGLTGSPDGEISEGTGGRRAIPTPDPVPAAVLPSAVEEGTPTDPLVFEGIVLDAKTNAPLDGVVVSAAAEDPACRHRRSDFSAADGDPGGDGLPPGDSPPPGALETLTGADGLFRIVWGEKTSADVVARKPGYGFGCAAGTPPGRRLVLRAKPGGSIRGVVRRPDGKAVSGALVFLHAIGEPGKTGPVLDSTTSDRHGAFELRGVAPGRYALRVRQALSMPAALDSIEPSSREVAIVLPTALRVWLEVSSDEGGIPAATLGVWRLEGLPWREGRVPLEPLSSGPRAAASSAAWARVLIPCERAEASLTITSPGFRPWTRSPIVLPPEGGETEAAVRLERDPAVGTLRLTIEDASGQSVRFEQSRARAVVRVAKTGAVVEGGPSAGIDPWVRKGLAPGAYRVEIWSPLYAPASLDVEIRAGDDVERTARIGPAGKLRVSIEAPGKRRVRFRLQRDGRSVPAYEDDPRAAPPADPDAATFFADAQGIVLTGLGAGELTVEVLSPDPDAPPTPATVVEGETKDVKISAKAR